MCRHCRTEIYREDSFCQECGLAQNNQAAKSSYPLRQASSGISEFDWPALEPDPVSVLNCPDLEGPSITSISSQTYAFANYQLDLQPWQADVDSPDDCSSFSNTGSKTCSAAESNCNCCQSPALLSGLYRPESPAADSFNSKTGMCGGIAMVATDIAVLAAVISFVSVLGVWGYSNFQKTEKASGVAIMAKARAAAVKADYQSVLTNLALIKAKTNGELDEGQQVLLNEAAYRLGEKEFAGGHAGSAMKYLNQVSITSDHYVSARQMIFNYTMPLHGFFSHPQAQADRVVAEGDEDKQKSSASPEATGQTAPLSDKQVLSIPVIGEIEKNNGEMQIKSEAVPVNQEEAPVPKFSESEISRYNRLLARYFVTHNGKAADDTAASEPPSFKEWLKQGKKAF